MKKIRVGLDARMVFYRQAGIGQYILNLASEMVRLADEMDVELTLWHSRKETRPASEWLGVDAPTRRLWTPPHHKFEQAALPIEIARSRLDVWHSPDFIPPLVRRNLHGRHIASVITVHDLAFKLYPELLTAESTRYYGQVERAVKSAERVIAVSHSTARDIVRLLNVPEEKITVVYEAANPLYHPLTPPELEKLGRQADLEKLTAKVGPTDFILFVSTIEPRKNLGTLLQAYRRLLDEFSDSQDAPKLVIAGREGWLFQDVYRQAEQLRLGDNLIWTGGVSQDELLWLYNRAVGLAMPSLYEGFGLPPLEAFACGTSVLVADISSLPEVVGELGRKLPPQDVLAWATALLDLWHNRAARRAETLATGPAWANSFSWRKAAQQTLQVYQEVSGVR